MNSSAKIIFCRATFVLLVVLPTFAILSYVICGIWRPIEMTPAAWSSLLSEKTGLEIRIAKMRRDGSGVFVLEQFEIGDPESDRIWLTSPRVEVTLHGDGLHLEANEMSIAASGMSPLSEHFQHRVLKSLKESFQPLFLRATHCKLLLADNGKMPVAISELEVSTKMNESGPVVELNAELLDDGAPVWVALIANRNRESGQAVTHFKWKVEGDAGISTSLLAEFSPEWNSLGQYAKFRGQIDGEASGYVLSGIELREIDLALLGERWGMAGMSGIASIGGERLGDAAPGAHIEFRNGKFTDLFGDVKIQSGAFDGPMLSRLARVFPLEAGGDFSKHPQIEFDNCSVRLELRGENLRVSGLLKSGGVLETKAGQLAWLSAPILRNARDIARNVLSEIHSEELPTSQWVAALPAPRSAAAASTANARKNSKSR